MTPQFFRKLYLYIVLSVFISIILTMGVMNILFQRHEQQINRGQMLNRAAFVQHLLQRLQEEKPNQLSNQLTTMGTYLNWRITYCSINTCTVHYGPQLSPLSKNQWEMLQNSNQQVIFLENTPPLMAALISKHEYVQFRPMRRKPIVREIRKQRVAKQTARTFRPILFAGLLISFFIGLLLLPYSRYIVRPMKELSDSITRVASGDFSTPLQVDPKSEFRGIADAFNHMVKQIQDMVQQKQRLIADVSHELRSPLARMRVSLELLIKEGRGNSKYLDKSVRELEQLDRLIDHLLVVSELELKPLAEHLSPLDLKTMIQENLDAHQLLLARHHLQVKLDVPHDEIVVSGDRKLLERALDNLFSNILKYAPEGSLVDIQLYLEDQWVVLSFRDRGPGVSRTDLPKLVEPFYRTDDSRSRKSGGTGLGLAIVQKVMTLHQGTLELDLPDDGEGGLLAQLRFPVNGC